MKTIPRATLKVALLLIMLTPLQVPIRALTL